MSASSYICCIVRDGMENFSSLLTKAHDRILISLFVCERCSFSVLSSNTYACFIKTSWGLTLNRPKQTQLRSGSFQTPDASHAICDYCRVGKGPVVRSAVRIRMAPAIFCCSVRGFSCTMLLGVIFVRPCWNLRFGRSCCVVLVTSMTPSCGMGLWQHVRTIREKLWWRARDDENCFTVSRHFSDRRQPWTFLGRLASASVFAASWFENLVLLNSCRLLKLFLSSYVCNIYPGATKVYYSCSLYRTEHNIC